MWRMRVKYPISSMSHFQSTFCSVVAVVVVDVVVVDLVEVVGVVAVAVAKNNHPVG